MKTDLFRWNASQLATLLLCVALAGCGGQPQAAPERPLAESEPPGPSEAGTTASPPPEPAKASPELRVATWDELQQQVAGNHGKITVVDLWATTCPPCIRELPGLGRLQTQFPDKVVCITFSLDYDGSPDAPADSYRDAILKVLSDQSLQNCVNYISGDPNDKIYESLNLSGIPAILVYRPDGALSKRFDNDKEEYGKEGFTYKEHVIPHVEKLVGES